VEIYTGLQRDTIKFLSSSSFLGGEFSQVFGVILPIAPATLLGEAFYHP
jgi:hypothetical protein